MTVLSIAFPLLPVGPGSGGGAEQILYLLERRLVALGYRSFVIAAEGSQISGTLVPSPAANGEIDDDVRREAQSAHRSLIEGVLRDCQVDIIHFHGLDFDAYIPYQRGRAAMLATLHLPLAWYRHGVFELPGVHFNCVSRHQASDANGRSLPAILNGVEIERYRAAGRRANGLLFIGRVCPEKGTDIALRVAHRLDLPLLVAGPVHPFRTHQEYFHDAVCPLLDEKRRYVGPVDLLQKIELLAGARAVLIPSLAAETSSLVAMEAACAGTPVVAYRSGALPEVVAEGETGFIVDSEQEMAHAVERCETIRAEACLRRAREQFDAGRMAAQYADLYRAIVKSTEI